ncbi:MAG: ATP-binding protein [Chitinophagales bacterium]
MKITANHKEQISAALQKDFESKEATFVSQNKYANSIGINSATVSNVINRKWRENPVLVSDKKWNEIALAINFQLSDKPSTGWQTANTEVFNHITNILSFCKNHSETAIFIDIAGIGKSYTCRQFQKNNPHVFIIEGSSATSKSRFIRELTKAVGLEVKGKYEEMMDAAIRRLLSFTKEQPLLILDEAGDLDDKTFLLIKQLYNRLEDKCGMFMTGAGGLRKKLDSGIRLDKNGFDEVADRFGYKESIVSIVPEDITQRNEYLAKMRAEICMANGVTSMDNIERIKKRGGTNRRAKKEINKLKAA